MDMSIIMFVFMLSLNQYWFYIIVKNVVAAFTPKQDQSKVEDKKD